MKVKVSCRSLRKLIHQLNLDIGHDGIHTGFLRRVSDSFVEVIVCFLTTYCSHCYVPGELLKGDITPVTKDAKGIECESSNYRPVMQSSCILKILEMHISDILKGKHVLALGSLVLKVEHLLLLPVTCLTLSVPSLKLAKCKSFF